MATVAGNRPVDEVYIHDDGHNGCCRTCVALMTETADKLREHINDESATMGRMEGQLGLLVKLVLAAITGIGGIAMLWVATLVSGR